MEDQITHVVQKRKLLLALVMACAVAVAGVPVPAAGASTGTPIMGKMQLTVDEMVDWFEAQDRDPQLSVSVRTLVRYFVEEGAAEGIRGDIAFAQAVHETGFFQYGGQVKPEHNNYAGIGAVDDGNNPAQFATARQGVRAQIHHLRAYADPDMSVYYRNPYPDEPVLSNPVVIPVNDSAPRFTYAFDLGRFGIAPTWEQLTGTWATDPNYHNLVLGRYGSMAEHAMFLRGATPLTGDWNGDGTETPGWYINGRFYLRNSHSRGPADVEFAYGRRGDVPVTGDWNGDGTTTVGILRDGVWHLRNEHRGGVADIEFRYGRLESGDYPITGDWNGNGTDTVGIVRGGEWHLRNENRGGVADIEFRYGRILDGDVPVVGDWTGDRIDTPGIRRGAEWHLRHVNRGGDLDVTVVLPALNEVGHIGGGGRPDHQGAQATAPTPSRSSSSTTGPPTAPAMRSSGSALRPADALPTNRGSGTARRIGTQEARGTASWCGPTPT
jgi:hypothetical protein